MSKSSPPSPSVSRLNRVLLTLEFVLAVVMLCLSVFAVFVFGGVAFTEPSGVLFLAVPLICCGLAGVAVHILGTAAFGDLLIISAREWMIAVASVIVCLLSLLLALFGPREDALIPLKLPSYGSVLIVPFFHCWVLRRRMMASPL